jgi:hypothetical protein
VASIGLDASQITALAAELVSIGEAVTDLDGANADASALILQGVNPPRRSGQLAAAGRADVSPNGFVIGYPIRYATYVHWGAPARNMRAQPWLLQQRDASYAELEQLYVQHAIDAINGAIK